MIEDILVVKMLLLLSHLMLMTCGLVLDVVGIELLLMWNSLLVIRGIVHEHILIPCCRH
jgi:hypothetical protein